MTLVNMNDCGFFANFTSLFYFSSCKVLEKLITISNITFVSWGHPVPEQSCASLNHCPNHSTQSQRSLSDSFYQGSLWHLSHDICWNKSINPTVFFYVGIFPVFYFLGYQHNVEREIEHTGEKLLRMSPGNWEQGSSGNTGFGIKEKKLCPETKVTVTSSWNSGALNIKFGVIKLRYCSWLCSQ